MRTLDISTSTASSQRSVHPATAAMKYAAALQIAATFATRQTRTYAHSWLECTDYRMTDGSASAKVWDPSLCKGRARCGARQADAGFGVDTGFNYHSRQGCQCARGSDNYNAKAPKAVYKPGQRVCLAYPPKNHVAAACTNPFIPDTGVVIRRTAAGSTSDDAFARDYQHGNGQHQSGVIDYKGFQNCPNFCEDMGHALCTMCFQLEKDIAPGEYTFKWIWEFNSADDAYSTCWEATVGGNGGGDNPAPAPTPSSSSKPSPSSSSPSPFPSPSPNSSPSPTYRPSPSSQSPTPSNSSPSPSPSTSPSMSPSVSPSSWPRPRPSGNWPNPGQQRPPQPRPTQGEYDNGGRGKFSQSWAATTTNENPNGVVHPHE